MKNILIPFILLTISVNFSFGQSDSIFIRKEPGVYHFYQGSRMLSVKEVISTMKSNKEAHQQMKSARLNNRLGHFTGGIGGWLFGWQVGTALVGEEPNLKSGGVGLGLIVVSFNYYKRGFKKARKAVNTFNSGLSPT